MLINRRKSDKFKTLTLFSESEMSTWKASVKLLSLPHPEAVEGRSLLMNQQEKFKPLRDAVKPMISLSIESHLAEIDQRIAKNHLSRMVKEVVFSLDTTAIEAKYSYDGQKSYHPKLLLSLLFYGYATGLRSSRQLSSRCVSDDYYKYLMQYYMPDHRTISDFRKNNIEYINDFFISILRIFDKLGYDQVGKISIDGTKLKANGSAKRTKSLQEFEEWLCRLEEEIASIIKEAEQIDESENASFKMSEGQKELIKKLKNRDYLKSKIEEAIIEIKKESADIEKSQEKKPEKKVQRNLTDGEAKHMKSGGSKDIRPGYNCQAVVTKDGVIIVAEAVTESNDRHQLKPGIEKAEANTGQAVKEVLGDSGYHSYENYEYLDQKKIDGYIPDQDFQKYKTGVYQREENRYHYTNFRYDEETDSYICPEGQRLSYCRTRKKKSKSRKWNHKVYRGGEGCDNCRNRSLCTKLKRRELLVDLREPLLLSMRKKLMSEKGAIKYFMRQYTIEPVFGHFKHNLGFRYFLLRGLKKVVGEFKLMCIGWNIKKMLTLGYKPAMVKDLRGL
jgi:transposase